MRELTAAKDLLDQTEGKEVKDKATKGLAAARKRLSDCLEWIGNSRLPKPCVEQCQNLYRLTNAAECDSDLLRKMLNFCPNRGAVGLYKIFAALGKVILAEAAAQLEGHSNDQALTSAINNIIDMGPVLENCHSTDSLLESALRVVACFSAVAGGSRFLKEKHHHALKRTSMAVAERLDHFTAEWVKKLHETLIDWLPEGSMDEDASFRDLLTAIKSKDMVSTNEEGYAFAGRAHTEVCQPLLAAIRSPNMPTAVVQPLAAMARRLRDYVVEVDSWKALFQELRQVDETMQNIRTVAATFAPVVYKLDFMPEACNNKGSRMKQLLKCNVKDALHVSLKAEMDTLLDLLEASEMRKGMKFKAMAAGKLKFLPGLDDQELLNEVLAHEADVASYDRAREMALVLEMDDIVIILSATQKMDVCRAKVAQAALDVIQCASPIKASAADPLVDEMEWKQDAAECLKVAKDALEEVGNYIAMERPIEYTTCLQDALSSCKTMIADGESMLRIIEEKVRSQWLAALQHLRGSVAACYPENWRQYCITMRDDAWITEHLIQNPLGAKLLARRGALDQAFVKIFGAHHMVAATIPERESTLTTELLTESKMMVGVRAALTVALTKMPLCKTAKSRAATLREVKRLIAALEIESFPSAVMTILDDASK